MALFPTRSTREVPVDDTVYRPPYIAAALAALGVFILYALTLAPSTAFWDTSEYIATAHVLGIPHPPGNPLFVLLARVWDIMLGVFGLPVAVRINLFSASMGALAHGCWFLLADRVLAFYSRDKMFRWIGATAAVLVSATAFTVWNQSNVNEKVYTVSLFTIALLSFLAFRWRDRLGEGKDDNLILLMVFILALSVANHLMAFLAAPALVLFILIVEPRTLSPIANWKLYAGAVAAVVLGLSVHLFLPIRAGLDPVINEADPTCSNLSSSVTSVLTFGKAGCAALSDALARRQYDKPSMFLDPVAASQGLMVPRSPALFFAQMANYMQYFDWQWARSVMGNFSWGALPRALVTLVFTLLGGYGALTNWRRDKKSFAYIAMLFITLSIGLVFYLNFKYGYTTPWRDAQNGNTEVRERDYFFIVSFSIWGLWVGIGLASLWAKLSDMFLKTELEHASPLHALRPAWATAPVLALALVPLFANWSWASRKGDYAARDWAYNLLMSVEPYGVVFTNGDNDTFPLWYLQEAEGIRKDVTVIVMSYLNTDWYARQLRDATTPCPANEKSSDDDTRTICQRPYVAPEGVTIYQPAGPGGETPNVAAASDAPGMRPPRKSILPLTDDQILQVASTPPYRTNAMPFRAGLINTAIPEGTPLVPADLFLAYIVTTSIEDRPIYFAMTTQAYSQLNLFDNLLRQGVAFKLNNGPIQADSTRGIYEIESGTASALTGRFVDLPRTETLVDKVFVHHPGFPDKWTHWTDIATEGIPSYYAYTLSIMAYLYERNGNHAKALETQRRAEPFLRLTDVRQEAYKR
ncbi:MAG: DUF2723 domain-containing protein [Longimicrobiales bacterium]